MINAKTISALVEELDLASPGVTSYMHRETSEIFTATDDMSDDFDDEFEDEDEDEGETGEQDQVDQEVGPLDEERAKFREIEYSDDWVRLPSHFDIHEWSIMRDFAYTIKDAGLQERLMSTLHRKGAFSNFKDAVFYANVRDKWFAFRKQELLRIRWIMETKTYSRSADLKNE